jgi:phage baseplate assembly protein V
VHKILEILARRISLMITKTILVSLDDSGAVQKLVLDALKDERRSNVDRFQEFGFSSNPPAGAELIMLSLGGSRSHNVVIASEDRASRPKDLAPGEAMIYNEAGDYVKVKSDGTIEIKCSTKVTIDAPLVEMTGNLNVAGAIVGASAAITGAVVAGTVAAASVSDGSGSVGSLRTAYNSHTHGGVQTGGGSTAGPTPTA